MIGHVKDGVLKDTLVIVQGASWGRAWPITLAGSPIDLTGWTVKAQVRPVVEDSTVLYEWSTAAGNASTANSSVALTVAPTVSSAWTWYNGVYDVELTSPDGTVYRIVEGDVVISREVTRVP